MALAAARRLRAGRAAPPALLRCAASTAAGADANRWALMQMTDASLPTGGFAHSAGLEAAWQQGRVRDTQQLLSFVRAAVGQAAHSSVPFVTAAHAAAAAGLTGEGEAASSALRAWADVDRRQHALLCGNATAARASQLQGSALLRVAEPLLADLGLDDSSSSSMQASRSAVHQLQQALRTPDPSGAIGVVHGHHAPVFGLVSGVLQMPADTVVEAFLFTVPGPSPLTPSPIC